MKAKIIVATAFLAFSGPVMAQPSPPPLAVGPGVDELIGAQIGALHIQLAALTVQIRQLQAELAAARKEAAEAKAKSNPTEPRP